jgi:hypothetical protein
MWVLKIKNAKSTERKFTVAMGGEYSVKPSNGNLMTGLNFNLSCCSTYRNMYVMSCLNKTISDLNIKTICVLKVYNVKAK